MAVRYNGTMNYHWEDKPLHCGRFPKNASRAMLPTHLPIKHFGWALEEDRIQKYARYMRVDPEGQHGIMAQYKSILDKKPNLIKFKSRGDT